MTPYERLDLEADDHGLVECTCGHIGFLDEADRETGECVNCVDGVDQHRDGLPCLCPDCERQAAESMAEARAAVGGLEWHLWRDRIEAAGLPEFDEDKE